ncbi:MAG: ESPR-type extended signal peptide-containing protein, partial [Stenotrophomonas sp.]
MNRIYRLVLNRTTGLCQVAPEHARRARGGRTGGTAGRTAPRITPLACACALLCAASAANATDFT